MRINLLCACAKISIINWMRINLIVSRVRMLLYNCQLWRGKKLYFILCRYGHPQSGYLPGRYVKDSKTQTKRKIFPWIFSSIRRSIISSWVPLGATNMRARFRAPLVLSVKLSYYITFSRSQWKFLTVKSGLNSSSWVQTALFTVVHGESSEIQILKV